MSAFFLLVLLHWANNETYFSHFYHILGLVLATEVPEIVQLVLNIELLELSSMPEVRSEHNVYFGASSKYTRGS